MVKVGKAFSGGLGQRGKRVGKFKYGVWACLRDWIQEEMPPCGVGPGQLACFRFEDRSQEFHFYGTNDELELVSADKIQAGKMREAEFIAMLP